jgi:hypothetical protein
MEGGLANSYHCAILELVPALDFGGEFLRLLYARLLALVESRQELGPG